jgi:hypothetical protein
MNLAQPTCQWRWGRHRACLSGDVAHLAATRCSVSLHTWDKTAENRASLASLTLALPPSSPVIAVCRQAERSRRRHTHCHVKSARRRLPQLPVRPHRAPLLRYSTHSSSQLTRHHCQTTTRALTEPPVPFSSSCCRRGTSPLSSPQGTAMESPRYPLLRGVIGWAAVTVALAGRVVVAPWVLFATVASFTEAAARAR